MNRRAFLRCAACAGGAWLWRDGDAAAAVSAPAPSAAKLRGVNLGGWLVLEKWITPGVFAGETAPDEYTLSQALGKNKAAARLQRHRETWITADDFAWLAQHGLNSVRLPTGYWILEENPPFISGAQSLDWAFRTAKENGLTILLDLHGAPGSQNGMDHSGRQGAMAWHTDKANITHTLDVVENLAQHCKQYDNLVGFELLNEPRWDMPLDILKPYYRDAYARVRKHLPAAQTAVVIHDSFRAMEWTGFMQQPDYKNVILDTHLYQCFTKEDRDHDIFAHIEIAGLERKRQLDSMRKELPTIVGEWSCALDPQSLAGLDGFEQDVAIRAYGSAQLSSYETSRGWYFWTYKTESSGGWNFRDCVKRGWLPDRYVLPGNA